MKTNLLVILILLCSREEGRSQNYHAIHGSSFAGSLGVANNPASIMSTPFAWDVNLFSFQLSTSTNAITVLNYSLLSVPSKSQYRINKGDYERYAKLNLNLHILNARIALNRRNSIAFGVNIRGYTDVNSGRYNFADTVKNLRNFLKINETNTNLHADVKSSNWLEIFGTYSKTLWDDERSRLHAGITVKGTRGIAGALAGLTGGGFTRTIQNNKPLYFVNAGSIRYGYSSNIDKWTKGRSASQNIADLLINSQGGVSIDLGLEYLIKPQTFNTFNDEDNYYNYDWKIAISLLDFGTTKYKYSSQSREAVNPKINLADTTLQVKFNKIGNIQSFNDSLASVFTEIRPIAGNFSIINPARLVINADRYVFGDFYLNGEISANLSFLAGIDKLSSSEINLLTVTPRWETKRYGIYLPIQLNSEHQFWIGAALKAGPLLLGVHNLGNIFSLKKTQNGGGYLALVIRPRARTKAFYDKRYDCPK